MDLRYDPRTIRRVSLSELHAGKIPEEQLKNSRVIIAHTRELSRTRVTLPLYGPTDRGTILAIGTASSLNGFSSKMPQQLTLMAILSSLLTLASFYVGYATTNINRIFIGFLRLFTIIMVSCYCETSFGGIPTKPASLTLTCLAVISVSVADRLKFFDLLRGLLSGVLSPEEVWVWRTYSDRDTPVVLFDAMGYIKKANPAAILEFQLDPKTWNQNLSELAKQCMPSLGQQNRRLTLQKNVRKVWDVDWPSKHLPIALFNNVTDQHDRLEELESQLVTDPMTGVLNRKGFQLAIESLDSNNTRNYTVFFMDMNGFKAVNDQYGHGAGDILLKVTAQRFRSAISNDDRVARFGGDEFAILIPRRISMEEALSIRDRIESTLIEKIDVGAAKVQVGVAVGFAIPFDEHETRESILERADHDMYQRKMMLKRDERIVKSKLLQEAEIGRMTF
jgi:diguanylate cyclase (GGDEF)-like protein